MNVKLKIVKGASRNQVVRLTKPKTVVGRAEVCDLRIPSAAVSRRHCILAFEDGALSIKDLDSANGTFVNGRRITGREPLCPGDQVTIGPLTFDVDYPLEVVDQSALPSVLPVEEEEASPPPSRPTRKTPAPPPEPVEEVAEAKPEDSEMELVFDIDDTESLKLPEGEDWRNILGNLEE